MKISAIVFIASTGIAAHAQQPAFDAISIKLADPAAPPSFGNSGGPGSGDPSRFQARRTSMLGLLTLAYGFESEADRISSPAWTRDFANVYDVVATVPAGTTKERFRLMLQAALAERFHLAVHREVRNFPGYELVVAKGVPKLKESVIAQNVAPQGDAPRIIRGFGPDRFPILPPGPQTSHIRSAGNARDKFQERSMAEFAADLGTMIGQALGGDLDSSHPRVTDKTGLTSKYDFTLQYSCAGCQGLPAAIRASLSPMGQPAPPSADAADPQGTGPTIFTAIQEQLGLRLDRVKDIPLDVVVVERLDKIPTEN